MKCSHCGFADTSVLESRKLLGGSVIRRRRGCGHCGSTFSTYEIDGGIWGTVKKWALGSHAPALEKRHALRERDGQIVAMVLAGYSQKQAADKFGVSVRTVCYAVKKAGLPTRRGKQPTKPVANPWSGLLS